MEFRAGHSLARLTVRCLNLLRKQREFTFIICQKTIDVGGSHMLSFKARFSSGYLIPAQGWRLAPCKGHLFSTVGHVPLWVSVPLCSVSLAVLSLLWLVGVVAPCVTWAQQGRLSDERVTWCMVTSWFPPSIKATVKCSEQQSTRNLCFPFFRLSARVSEV